MTSAAQWEDTTNCIIGLGLACIAKIDEGGAVPNGPTGFHIAGTIANHVVVRQRNSKLIRGLQKHSGLWLAPIAGFLDGVAERCLYPNR